MSVSVMGEPAIGIMGARLFRLVRQHSGACSHAVPAGEVTIDRRAREMAALCGAVLAPSWGPAPVTMACMMKVGTGSLVAGKS